ncbi:MAG: hypothetical protein NZ811_01920 [Gammaproteobacteria bacterium]|nr:hypothetical protein [Gammaproteobacteria bacterium]
MSSEINDILKLLDLDQTEINALSDKEGLYNNTTTGNLEYNGAGIGGSGTVEPLPIISLSSTDVSSSIIQSTPTVLDWDVETEKDTGFTHSNITNNSRIEVDAGGTYEIEANIRIESAEQRAQFVVQILIDGVVQSQPYGSSYIRNSGNSSDFWTCVVNPPPLKLTAGQYIEIQAQIESQITTAISGTFIGTGSSFSMVNLQGTKGETGATGAGSNIVVKKNGVTVGTVSDVINFITSLDVVDSGGNETEVTLGDMLKSIYDPTNVNADAFDYANAIGITQITDNIITPSTLNSDQDDYNPTGFSTCNMIRQQINGDRVITGFEAPPVGVNRVFAINNLSTSSSIKFKNNDSGSSAANRLLLRDDGPDKSIKENETAIFWYDHTSSRYRPYNRIG